MTQKYESNIDLDINKEERKNLPDEQLENASGGMSSGKFKEKYIKEFFDLGKVNIDDK